MQIVYVFLASGWFLALLGGSILLRKRPLLKHRVRIVRWLKALFGLGAQDQNLRDLRTICWEIEESLSAGLIPRAEVFQKLALMPRVLAEISTLPIFEMREQGCELRPTIKRIRIFAEKSLEISGLSRAKTMAAFSQSLICMGMIPVFGLAYYRLLPGLTQSPWIWWGSCSVSFLLSSLGLVWIFQMAMTARFGGVKFHERSWILYVQCLGERLLSRVRQGEPPDLVWARLLAQAPASCSDLVVEWSLGSSNSETATLSNLLRHFGQKVNEMLALMTMEGRPTLERLSGWIDQMNTQLELTIRKELEALPVRALKPLFILVCPSVLILAFLGLFLGLWSETQSGLFL